MSHPMFKNIAFSEILDTADLVSYQEGQVVSRTLSQNQDISITLFAFDEGEELSTHASGGDAWVYLLDGESNISIGDETFHLSAGQSIIMPANIPHGLTAAKRFKMILIVLFNR